MESGPNNILSRLNISVAPRSLDYVERKKQFHLHNLLTEQRHPQTWDLSSSLKRDIAAGLEQIFAVERDIEEKFARLASEPDRLEQAAAAVGRALQHGNKIFIYGCGATGRLAKQMESTFWRPFWQRLRSIPGWEKVWSLVPENVTELLIGEMTGGDRALISALEGFEDLELVGKLQLQEHGISRGDVVFCVTEGGETSSVIGAVLAAAELYPEPRESSVQVYFIYNNPDERILPFARSRKVLEHPGITKIDLTTGPQALAGSTRMQAATSETYVLGLILEFGIRSVLSRALSPEELVSLNFSVEKNLPQRLLDFRRIRSALMSSLPEIAAFTALETEVYRRKGYTTYAADRALITVFIDCAERSPTFHLYPLDTVKEKTRKCWVRIWTRGQDKKQAWINFLGRDFRGLEKDHYEPHFQHIQDDYLKKAALASLAQAGSNQEEMYDFSWQNKRRDRRGLEPDELGVLVCMDDEIAALGEPGSFFSRFVSHCRQNNTALALLLVGEHEPAETAALVKDLSLPAVGAAVVKIFSASHGDPLGLARQVLLKVLLNAHSTAVMAGLGKVVGNTMTNVSPSNLKLIGRATYLIQSHVNDAVPPAGRISYAEANAVLFDTLDYTAAHEKRASEVDLAVIRILKMLRENTFIDLDEAVQMVATSGLESYLAGLAGGQHERE